MYVCGTECLQSVPGQATVVNAKPEPSAECFLSAESETSAEFVCWQVCWSACQGRFAQALCTSTGTCWTITLITHHTLAQRCLGTHTGSDQTEPTLTVLDHNLSSSSFCGRRKVCSHHPSKPFCRHQTKPDSYCTSSHTLVH